MVNKIKNNKLTNDKLTNIKFNNKKDTDLQSYSELDDVTITKEYDDNGVSIDNNTNVRITSNSTSLEEEAIEGRHKEVLKRKETRDNLDSKDEDYSEKSWGATLAFCILLGFIGFHRFYVGKAGTAILMLLTLGGFGIWIVVDLVSIIINSFTDEEGKVVKRRDVIEVN